MPIVLAFLTRVLTSKATITLITALAKELAKRTDNKVDDAAVEVIETVLATGVVTKD